MNFSIDITLGGLQGRDVVNHRIMISQTLTMFSYKVKDSKNSVVGRFRKPLSKTTILLFEKENKQTKERTTKCAACVLWVKDIV